MENEEGLSEAQNQDSQQDSQEQSQPAGQAPSTVSFSEEQVQRALAMQARNTERALAAAQQAREEADRYRQMYEQRQNQQPAYNFEELNRRAAEGQFAEVQADIVKAEMQRMLQPLLQQNAEQARERKFNAFVDSAINSHMYSDFVRQGRDHLITYVRSSIGSREPDEFLVKSLVDGAVGQAIAQNPNMIAEFYGRSPQTQTQNQPQTQQTAPKPIPHRVPTGRPLVSASPSGNSILDESEKRIKAQNPEWATMSDEEWKEEFYAPDQIISFDLNKIMNPGKK